MKKQDKKRTVASFLSHRLKQQVNESYDYLEESEKRVQPSAIDEVAIDSDAAEEPKKIQGASVSSNVSQQIDGFPRLDAPAVLDLANELEGLKSVEGSSNSGGGADSFRNELAIHTVFDRSFKSFTREDARESSSNGGEVIAPLAASIVGGDRPLTEAKSIETGSDYVVENPLSESPLIIDPEKSCSSEIDAVRDLGVLSSESTASADMTQIPSKLFLLLVTGDISIRSIQIYLAMFRDAGMRAGGIAKLSYNELSSITAIQTPHIPGILKNLIELKLIERFRTEKAATSKNGYIIL